MQRFIYLENQYVHVYLDARLVVEYDHENEEFKFATVTDGGRVVNSLPVKQAAVLAGYLLSKHPAIAKGDAIAFTSVTRACDAIPEANFTVIPPPVRGLRATTGEQPLEGDGDDQDVKVPDSAPAGTGDLHPDQERRLTALREVSKLLAGRLSHERLSEWAGWVLNGDTLTN